MKSLRLKCLLPLTLALAASSTAIAQPKVATYAFGKSGTPAYEELSFWVKDGKRADIYYARGKGRAETKASYLPRVGMANGASFSVKLPTGSAFTIIPSGTQLKVSDSAGGAPKTFVWHYEGPVDGSGTFCRECAENKEEAMRLVRTYYLK
jgi:hypothetical protein